MFGNGHCLIVKAKKQEEGGSNTEEKDGKGDERKPCKYFVTTALRRHYREVSKMGQKRVLFAAFRAISEGIRNVKA